MKGVIEIKIELESDDFKKLKAFFESTQMSEPAKLDRETIVAISEALKKNYR